MGPPYSFQILSSATVALRMLYFLYACRLCIFMSESLGNDYSNDETEVHISEADILFYTIFWSLFNPLPRTRYPALTRLDIIYVFVYVEGFKM